MPNLTFDQAQQVHRAIADDHDHGGAVIYPFLRRWAANRLANDDWPEGEGMGTSDISIALTEALAQFDAPRVGPVQKAYERCGFDVPEWWAW